MRLFSPILFFCIVFFRFVLSHQDDTGILLDLYTDSACTDLHRSEWWNYGYIPFSHGGEVLGGMDYPLWNHHYRITLVGDPVGSELYFELGCDDTLETCETQQIFSLDFTLCVPVNMYGVDQYVTGRNVTSGEFDLLVDTKYAAKLTQWTTVQCENVLPDSEILKRIYWGGKCHDTNVQRYLMSNSKARIIQSSSSTPSDSCPVGDSGYTAQTITGDGEYPTSKCFDDYQSIDFYHDEDFENLHYCHGIPSDDESVCNGRGVCVNHNVCSDCDSPFDPVNNDCGYVCAGLGMLETASCGTAQALCVGPNLCLCPEDQPYPDISSGTCTSDPPVDGKDVAVIRVSVTTVIPEESTRSANELFTVMVPLSLCIGNVSFITRFFGDGQFQNELFAGGHLFLNFGDYLAWYNCEDLHCAPSTCREVKRFWTHDPYFPHRTAVFDSKNDVFFYKVEFVEKNSFKTQYIDGWSGRFMLAVFHNAFQCSVATSENSIEHVVAAVIYNERMFCSFYYDTFAHFSDNYEDLRGMIGLPLHLPHLSEEEEGRHYDLSVNQEGDIIASFHNENAQNCDPVEIVNTTVVYQTAVGLCTEREWTDETVMYETFITPASPAEAYFTCDGVKFSHPTACNRHGACVGQDECQCFGGWYDDYCTRVDCNGIESSNPSVCTSIGVCFFKDLCVCPIGYQNSAGTCVPTLSDNVGYIVQYYHDNMCSDETGEFLWMRHDNCGWGMSGSGSVIFPTNPDGEFDVWNDKSFVYHVDFTGNECAKASYNGFYRSQFDIDEESCVKIDGKEIFKRTHSVMVTISDTSNGRSIVPLTAIPGYSTVVSYDFNDNVCSKVPLSVERFLLDGCRARTFKGDNWYYECDEQTVKNVRELAYNFDDTFCEYDLTAFESLYAVETCEPTAYNTRQIVDCLPITTCHGVNSTSHEVCSGHGTCLAEGTCECDGIWNVFPNNCSEKFQLYNCTADEPDSICGGHGECKIERQFVYSDWIENTYCACESGWYSTSSPEAEKEISAPCTSRCYPYCDPSEYCNNDDRECYPAVCDPECSEGFYCDETADYSCQPFSCDPECPLDEYCADDVNTCAPNDCSDAGFPGGCDSDLGFYCDGNGGTCQKWTCGNTTTCSLSQTCLGTLSNPVCEDNTCTPDCFPGLYCGSTIGVNSVSTQCEAYVCNNPGCDKGNYCLDDTDTCAKIECEPTCEEYYYCDFTNALHSSRECVPLHLCESLGSCNEHGVCIADGICSCDEGWVDGPNGQCSEDNKGKEGEENDDDDTGDGMKLGTDEIELIRNLAISVGGGIVGVIGLGIVMAIILVIVIRRVKKNKNRRRFAKNKVVPIEMVPASGTMTNNTPGNDDTGIAINKMARQMLEDVKVRDEKQILSRSMEIIHEIRRVGVYIVEPSVCCGFVAEAIKLEVFMSLSTSCMIYVIRILEMLLKIHIFQFSSKEMQFTFYQGVTEQMNKIVERHGNKDKCNELNLLCASVVEGLKNLNTAEGRWTNDVKLVFDSIQNYKNIGHVATTLRKSVAKIPKKWYPRYVTLSTISYAVHRDSGNMKLFWEQFPSVNDEWMFIVGAVYLMYDLFLICDDVAVKKQVFFAQYNDRRYPCLLQLVSLGENKRMNKHKKKFAIVRNEAMSILERIISLPLSFFESLGKEIDYIAEIEKVIVTRSVLEPNQDLLEIIKRIQREKLGNKLGEVIEKEGSSIASELDKKYIEIKNRSMEIEKKTVELDERVEMLKEIEKDNYYRKEEFEKEKENMEKIQAEKKEGEEKLAIMQKQFQHFTEMKIAKRLSKSEEKNEKKMRRERMEMESKLQRLDFELKRIENTEQVLVEKDKTIQELMKEINEDSAKIQAEHQEAMEYELEYKRSKERFQQIRDDHKLALRLQEEMIKEKADALAKNVDGGGDSKSVIESELIVQSVMEDAIAEDDDSVPPDFKCPISLTVMEDPVIVPESGNTYERAMITQWLKENRSDPLTGVKLVNTNLLIPNLALKRSIIHWRENVKKK